MFDGGDVFILGGGASLVDFNWGALDGKRCIAVNNAWRKLPSAKVMFFGDMRFYERNRNRDVAGDFWRYKGEIITSLPELASHPRIKFVDLNRPDLNSGFQAALLAFELNADRAVLVGFDGVPGRWSDGESYKHQGSVADAVYDRYVEQAESLSGLPIVTADMASAYPWFEKMPLDTLLNHS